jgi:hypothetical protein
VTFVDKMERSSELKKYKNTVRKRCEHRYKRSVHEKTEKNGKRVTG